VPISTHSWNISWFCGKSLEIFLNYFHNLFLKFRILTILSINTVLELNYYTYYDTFLHFVGMCGGGGCVGGGGGLRGSTEGYALFMGESVLGEGFAIESKYEIGEKALRGFQGHERNCIDM
jgi:hypothetical protein